MVLRNGPWGPYMACPGYNEDPPCKTVRRLHQKQQQKPPQPLDEKCPKCGEQLVLRNGQYGEFVSCSAYPKCKYIKQNTIGVKCPVCHVGDSGREEGTARQPLLRLLGVSEVHLHCEQQAGRQAVSGVRQPVSAGEDSQVRRVPRLPQQQEAFGRRRSGAEEAQKERRARKRGRVQLHEADRGCPTPHAGCCSYCQDAWAGGRAAGGLGRPSRGTLRRGEPRMFESTLATTADADLILKLYELRTEATMREARAWMTGQFFPQTAEEFFAVANARTQPGERLVPAGDELLGDGGGAWCCTARSTPNCSSTVTTSRSSSMPSSCRCCPRSGRRCRDFSPRWSQVVEQSPAAKAKVDRAAANVAALRAAAATQGSNRTGNSLTSRIGTYLPRIW